mgnify:CR=1 FL=1
MSHSVKRQLPAAAVITVIAAAFYNMFRGTVHVIVGSGLTIAGAVACLYFTRLPYFQTLGVPAAIGVLVFLLVSVIPQFGTIMRDFGARHGPGTQPGLHATSFVIASPGARRAMERCCGFRSDWNS